MTQNQTPLAGVLHARQLPAAQREAALQEASRLPKIVLNPLSISDVELLGNGAYTPLTGFLNKADYTSVVDTMHLVNGSVWSIPITLPVDREFADSIKEDQRVVLTEPDGHILAIVTVEEKFDYDKKREAREVFRTEEEKHPGVARLYQQGDVLLGGPIEVIDFPGNRPFM
ncbi:partial Sulfate adenylyltransferase, partial [Anaerolineae bacterium]